MILILLSFAAGGLADGEAVGYQVVGAAFVALSVGGLDLYGHAELVFEHLFCIAHLGAAFDLETVGIGFNCLGGLLVELVQGEVAISDLYAFVEDQVQSEGFLEIGRDGFQFLVWRYCEFCLVQAVFNVV